MEEREIFWLCFTSSTVFSILYSRGYGIVSVLIGSFCGVAAANYSRNQLFHGIWEIESTIRFTQTVAYFITILCISWMFMFPQNLTLQLTVDSTLFDKIAMCLLIVAGCIGTNLIIIFVWDAVYGDYLKLADGFGGSTSKFHKKTVMVIRPELVLVSVINVLVCAMLKAMEKDRMMSFMAVYFVVVVPATATLISCSYTKAKVLRIASTETIAIQTLKGEVCPDASVYQVGYILAWKDGSMVRHVSLHDVQQIEVRKGKSSVSVWKPEYCDNQFRCMKAQ